MNKSGKYIKIKLNNNNSKQRKNITFSPILKYFLIIFLVVLIFTGISGLLVFFTMKDVVIKGQASVKILYETYAVLKNQDIDKTQEKLVQSEKSLTELSNKIDTLSWFGKIPIIGNYQKDLGHLVNAGLSGVQAGKIAIDTILPYSDLLGLKGKSTFVSGSADDRIKTAVDTLDKVIPSVDKIAEKIVVIEKELDQIDPNRYPEKIGKYTIKSRIKSSKELFNQTAKLFVDAKPLLKKFPELLGNKGEKRYLVLFQNDAELRPTGGFISAYGIFKVDKGKIQVETSNDIYNLDKLKKTSFPVPEPIKKYHIGVNTFELRDSNLSPDFVTSMNTFQDMINKSVPSFPPYSGVIAVDTHVLVSAIKILGDFNIYGRKFSAETDKRCDCPKAIYELEDYATKPVGYVREERKDIIGVLLYQIMQRSLGVSPSKYWGKLSQMFIQEAVEKHVLFYFKDEDAQKGIEAINFGGRIQSFDGDYIHVSNTNFAGAKSNLFVRQYYKQEITKDNNGDYMESLMITYKNPMAASNCNLEAGQLCLNGILRNWVRIYVPKGAKLIEFKGSEMKTSSYEELDKTVFEGFLKVNPKGQSEIKIQYSVPKNVIKNNKYSLMVQKQPGTDGFDMEIKYNGKIIIKSPLIKDEILAVD